MKVFLTGAAGFIGFQTALALLKDGVEVHGFDCVNNYYDPFYKNERLKILANYDNFIFTKGYLEDAELLNKVYYACAPTHIVHLAAQAGVRYSIENPTSYINSNIVGFQNIIELARHSKSAHFVYASSSSVYGSNKNYPFSECHDVSNPISLYAATKISNELVAKTYGHLYQIPSTGLRFFTVYGPYGRPDMALFTFTQKILKGEPIPIFNFGHMIRDFTYIEDIVKGILTALVTPQYNQIYNLGRGREENLLHIVNLLEGMLGKKANKNFLPLQAGDVEKTMADIAKANRDLKYDPVVTIEEGIRYFVDWYLATHQGLSSTQP